MLASSSPPAEHGARASQAPLNWSGQCGRGSQNAVAEVLARFEPKRFEEITPCSCIGPGEMWVLGFDERQGQKPLRIHLGAPPVRHIVTVMSIAR